MADVTDSKSVGSDTVWVQVPLPAPKKALAAAGAFFVEIGFHSEKRRGCFSTSFIDALTALPKCFSREKSAKNKEESGIDILGILLYNCH